MKFDNILVLGGSGFVGRHVVASLRPDEPARVTAVVERADKLDALNLTVDYYSIDISDMISIQPVEVVYEKCLSATPT